jgi:hypothetical protein
MTKARLRGFRMSLNRLPRVNDQEPCMRFSRVAKHRPIPSWYPRDHPYDANSSGQVGGFGIHIDSLAGHVTKAFERSMTDVRKSQSPSGTSGGLGALSKKQRSCSAFC